MRVDRPWQIRATMLRWAWVGLTVGLIVGCGLRQPQTQSLPNGHLLARATATATTRPSSLPTAQPTEATLASTDPRRAQRSATPTPQATIAPTVRPSPTAPPTLVYLDAGHGGVDSGGTGTAEDGTAVMEKTITLVLAEKTAHRLEADGIGVVLSRQDDSLPGVLPADYADAGQTLTPTGVLADLQRRIDRANASGARVFLSIHLNYYSDPAVAGAQVFYDSARPFDTQNARFADLIQSSLILQLRSAGYSTPDRGATDDQDVVMPGFGTLGDYNHLVVLGPGVARLLRPTSMPGALSEPLFLSNPPEATAALQPDVQDLLATAYVDAIERFLHVGAQSGGVAT